MSKIKMQNAITQVPNCNQEWIEAGRYHPDWTLKDWQRELERSSDLWWAVNRLDEESVTGLDNFQVFNGNKITDHHRFTNEHEGNEYILLQQQHREPSVFWL